MAGAYYQGKYYGSPEEAEKAAAEWDAKGKGSWGGSYITDERQHDDFAKVEMDQNQARGIIDRNDPYLGGEGGLREQALKYREMLNPGAYGNLAKEIANLRTKDLENAEGMGFGALGGLNRYAQGNRSIAAQQGALEQERLRRGSQSQMASARGGYNPALARAAMQGLGRQQVDLASQTAINAAMEKQNALRALAQASVAQQGATNQNIQGRERRIGQRTALTGMDQAMAQNLLNQSMGRDDALMNRNLDQKFGWEKKREAQGGAGEALGGLLGGAGGLAAALAVFSDRRAKSQVNEADAPVGEFLRGIDPYQYNYKDPARHGSGRRVGVMAQDLERSQIGQRMVGQAPDGTKTVDMSPGTFNPLVLASLAHLSDRLDRAEGRKS